MIDKKHKLKVPPTAAQLLKLLVTPLHRPEVSMGTWRKYMGQMLRKLRRHRKKRRHSWSSYEHESDDMEMHVVRYKPDGLDALCRSTKFTKKELQLMYRGFKQECPSGIVDEETFKAIYSQFFPQGDASHYAEYVFKTFDHDHSGAISFEDFVVGLSILSRGSLNEKLQWTFNLYDINGDGFITKDELYDIVTSIYSLVGKYGEQSVEDSATKDHVDRVFERLDLNQDGVVTMDEFMDSLSKDAEVVKSLGNLDTVL